MNKNLNQEVIMIAALRGSGYEVRVAGANRFQVSGLRHAISVASSGQAGVGDYSLIVFRLRRSFRLSFSGCGL